MQGIVCHFTPVSNNRVASARISRWLAHRYGLDIIDSPAPEKVKDYELAICVSSASGFADPELREQIGEICARAKHYVFAQQDFLTSQAGQIGKWFDNLGKDRNKRHVWSTIPRTLKNKQDRYINWNMLTFKAQPCLPQKAEVPGMFYYGAARKGRLKYLERYFGGIPPYPVTISSTKPGIRKLMEIAPAAEFVEPFEDLSEIGKYQATLYLEDEYSHKHYCSPANRWYECLSFCVPMLFDVSCRGTFHKAGYPVDDYIVRNQDDVARMLGRSEEIRKEQFDRWGRDHYQELCDAVDAAMKGLFE